MSDPIRDPVRLAAIRSCGLLTGQTRSDLEALLDLAGRILGTQVGLVSIVDDERQHFVGNRGLEVEWAREGTPLSHSFCQYVVIDDEALVISDARDDDRLSENPAIGDLGVVAYAGVPIRDDDGNVLGSFCAIDGQPKQWTEDDIAVLATLAEGVRSRLSVEHRYRKLVQTLQYNLLPAVSDDTGRWRIDATYRAAMGAGIGGDFFDTQAHEDGSIWLVVGDVVGHGIDATVAMAQLQAAARTALTINQTLVETIEALDRVAGRLEGARHAGIAVARFSPQGREMEFACCGFLPPLLVTESGACFDERGQSAPLGRPATRRTVTVDLEGVEGVVFTTDGLVERRGEHIDDGLARLASAAPAAIGKAEPASVLADQLGDDSDDDVAVVVIRPST